MLLRRSPADVGVRGKSHAQCFENTLQVGRGSRGVLSSCWSGVSGLVSDWNGFSFGLVQVNLTTDQPVLRHTLTWASFTESSNQKMAAWKKIIEVILKSRFHPTLWWYHIETCDEVFSINGAQCCPRYYCTHSTSTLDYMLASPPLLFLLHPTILPSPPIILFLFFVRFSRQLGCAKSHKRSLGYLGDADDTLTRRW